MKFEIEISNTLKAEPVSISKSNIPNQIKPNGWTWMPFPWAVHLTRVIVP